jgi:hypothetical protein
VRGGLQNLCCSPETHHPPLGRGDFTVLSSMGAPSSLQRSLTNGGTIASPTRPLLCMRFTVLEDEPPNHCSLDPRSSSDYTRPLHIFPSGTAAAPRLGCSQSLQFIESIESMQAQRVLRLNSRTTLHMPDVDYLTGWGCPIRIPGHDLHDLHVVYRPVAVSPRTHCYLQRPILRSIHHLARINDARRM